MRTIQKQISLEPMTSRLPSVWPSYMNNELYFFDEESLKKREWQYTNNWGMVPVNIVLNHNPSEGIKWNEYELARTCHCYSDSETTYDNLCNFTLSFERLSKWYYFFNEYYNLLKQYSHCNRVYTSAEDYYNYESNTKYASQMKYGCDKQTYLDLDKEFARKGGIAEVLVFNKDTSEYASIPPKNAHDETKGDRMVMVDVYDIGFFKWICENVVPSFIIPMEYKDYWKRDKLFYPDVIKWMAWFFSRLDYEEKASYEKPLSGEVESWDCKESGITNCCDCEEYFNRGGKRIYLEMVEWFERIQSGINKNVKEISGYTKCFIPTIIFPIELQTSIDDLGEFSIFSTKYELGIDYRGTNNLTETENTKVGTVSTINEHSIILNEGSGYTFNPEYMEKYVSRCLEDGCGYEGVFYGKCPKCGSENVEIIGWNDYTNHYINHEYEWDDGVMYNYKNDFYISSITYFSYDNENVKYTSSSSTESDAIIDLANQMSKKYILSTRENGWVLIDNALYPINRIEYATYDKANKYLGDKKYMVFREEGTNTPYTFINGKKIYADFYIKENKFYFPFFKKLDYTINETTCSGNTFNFNDYVQFERNNLNQNQMYYIEYNGNAYEILEEASTIEINGLEYERISGYTLDSSNNEIYYTYNKELISGDTLSNIPKDAAVISSSTKYFDNKPFIYVFYPFEVQAYLVDEVNGRAVSKLLDLRLYDVLTDDVGNDIDGIYELNKSSIYNHQPPEGTTLEPLYQVGNTANISRFSLTEENLDKIVNNKNYFIGDIITEMVFYYKETDNTIQEKTITKVKLNEYGSIDITYCGKSESIPSGYTSLSAISISTSAKTELEKMEDETHIFIEDIFCDITYYVSATLVREEYKNYNLCYENDKNNYGIEYKETVQFVKENREYYLKKQPNQNNVLPTKRNDVSSHSISYPIYVYKLSQTKEHVYDSQYDSSYDVCMADFKFKIDIFSGGTDTFNGKMDVEKYNGLQVLPVFREEYRFGVSSIESIDSDIYIDRGVNAAFEKHLKLGEVTTLEALVNYGNNYFKIMDS